MTYPWRVCSIYRSRFETAAHLVNQVTPRVPMRNECPLATAATGNAGGFCLVSDRNASKTGFANFAVANDLPVAALQFVRVPFRAGGSLDGSRRIRRADAPMGVVISDPDRSPIQRLSPPALAGIADRPQRYFRISERRSGIVLNLSPHGRRHPRPVFWLSRPLR
jgi:hypothetical protein